MSCTVRITMFLYFVHYHIFESETKVLGKDPVPEKH